MVTTYDEYKDLLFYLSAYLFLSVKTFCFAKTTQMVKKTRPKPLGHERCLLCPRLAPCYLLADKHGQTATRHLGLLLTTTALPAEDTDHLILVGWQKTKPGSGPRDGSFVEGGRGGRPCSILCDICLWESFQAFHAFDVVHLDGLGGFGVLWVLGF